MRHLPAGDVASVLRRRRSVEQFLGGVPGRVGQIRHVEVRPSADGFEVWVHDVEDVGSEAWLDLYDFPSVAPDDPDRPAATFSEPIAAIAFAENTLAAKQGRWVNQGVSESDYLDYIRAGRPACWMR